MPRFAFADVVRIRHVEATVARGIAGATGMIVASKAREGSGEIVGAGDLKDAVLVSLYEPIEEVVLITGALLEPTGEKADWEIVDGRP